MMSSIVRIAKTLGLIAVFSVAGFAVVRLAFALICWISGHDLFEAMVGLIAAATFGLAIGIEAYLWFKDWRSRKRTQDFDTSR